MRAVIFDIDGTLLQSNELDDRTYASVIKHVLGPVRLRDSWSQYKNISGSGTLLEILADNDIADSEGMLRAAENEFVAQISSHIEDHGPILEVPGAKDFVCKLAKTCDCKIAYATAGWGASARLKLKSSQFPLDNVPLASCNDHIDKASIMAHALVQLDATFESITYYGDSESDRRAAEVLGWSFVPVGEKLSGLRRFG